MEENSLLMSTAMKIILNAGNARTKADEALTLINDFHFDKAHEKILAARDDIKKAHQAQTEIIQNEAAGQTYQPCLLFTHAQDTLMTIMSEVNLIEKMIMLFETLYQLQEGKHVTDR